jgi:hypothetical protein
LDSHAPVGSRLTVVDCFRPTARAVDGHAPVGSRLTVVDFRSTARAVDGHATSDCTILTG